MKKLLTLYEESDECGVNAQEVYDKENGKSLFWCNNLSECPEDAIIGRDLFDAGDFIGAVELGMKLAKEGYDDIELVKKRR